MQEEDKPFFLLQATALNKNGQTPIDTAQTIMEKSGKDLTQIIRMLEDAAGQQTDFHGRHNLALATNSHTHSLLLRWTLGRAA